MEKIFRFSTAYQMAGWTLMSLSSVLLLSALFFVNRATRPALGVVSVACTLLIAFGLYFLFVASTTVTLTNTTLIWQRGGPLVGVVRKTIPYTEIVAIRYQPNQLTLVTAQEELHLVKQMENYAEFYTLLQQKVKPVRPQDIPFPIVLHTSSRWPYILGVIAFLVFAVFFARSYPGALWERIFILLFFSVPALWAGTELILKRPFQYTFTADHILVMSSLQTRTIPTHTIQNIQISQRTSSSRGFERLITRLEITLANDQFITIDETDIAYPIEELQLLLKERYLPSP